VCQFYFFWLVTDSWSWYIKTFICCWTCWRILRKVCLLACMLFLAGPFHLICHFYSNIFSIVFLHLICGNKGQGDFFRKKYLLKLYTTKLYNKMLLCFAGARCCFWASKTFVADPEGLPPWVSYRISYAHFFRSFSIHFHIR
jgi:hypothetical protein